MKLKFSSIADRGDPKKERIVLKALGQTDIGEYAIFRVAGEPGVITTAVEDTFWFPDKPIDAGDLVVVYTKAGSQSEKVLKSGKRAHFFYWGTAGATHWNNSGSIPVVVHIDEWMDETP